MCGRWQQDHYRLFLERRSVSTWITAIHNPYVSSNLEVWLNLTMLDLSAVLGTSHDDIAHLVTSGFDVREPGLTESPERPNIHRPRTLWHDVDVLPPLPRKLWARFQAPWVDADIAHLGKDGEFTRFVRECRHAPLLVAHMGLTIGSRLEISRSSKCIRQLKCGWCARHWRRPSIITQFNSGSTNFFAMVLAPGMMPCALGLQLLLSV